MKLLITGASGFLGRAVATAAVSAGHDVTTFQRRPSAVDGAHDVLGSIADASALEYALDGIEGIIHLAAKVSLVGERADFERINIEGTARLIELAKKAGVSRFVQVSSPSVAHAGTSLHGVGADRANPATARGEYARTKAIAELYALGNDAPDFAVVAVRPHLVWGPGDTQLLERIVERANQGRLPIVGTGAALIDTTYVDNAAAAMLAALDQIQHIHGTAYVVTNGEPRPVAELIAGMCRAAGAPAPRWAVSAGLAAAAGELVEKAWPRVVRLQNRGDGGSSAAASADDQPPMTRFLAEQLSTAHWFDQRKTRRDLNWTPAVSIDEGLRRVTEHYVTNRNALH